MRRHLPFCNVFGLCALCEREGDFNKWYYNDNVHQCACKVARQDNIVNSGTHIPSWRLGLRLGCAESKPQKEATVEMLFVGFYPQAIHWLPLKSSWMLVVLLALIASQL
jgi:hypothetical protein